MTTLREAAQQALEALAIGRDAAYEVAQTYHEAMAGYRPARHIAVDDDVRKIEDAITALRAALAEAVQDWEAVAADQAMTIALMKAEPVQEPVAWRIKNATPPVVFQQYPSAVADLGGEIEPLYTAPPQRKPLSGEQLRQIELGLRIYYDNGKYDLSLHDFARAIERAHGIGENT